MVDFITGYQQGYADALRDLANRGIITQTAAPLVGTSPSGMSMAIDAAASTPPPRKRKTNRKANRKLSAALREANRRLRTKSGALRKGKTQKDVMVLAQRLRKKM